MMKNNDIQQFYNILNVCFMLVKVIVQMLPILENSRDISKLFCTQLLDKVLSER